jgi:hypothetical protein
MRISASDLLSALELDLSAASWDGSIDPYPSQTPAQFAKMSLYRSLTKKFISGSKGTTPAGDADALALFIESNELCRQHCMASLPRTEAEEIAIGEAKAFLYDFFYPKPRCTVEWVTPDGLTGPKRWLNRDFVLNFHDIGKYVGHGPGASVGSKSTDFYTKMATSELTQTDPTMHMLYVQAVRSHPTWKECEVYRSKFRGVRTVPGNRLSFVPKTAKISRTICTEPLLNMFFQKGIQGCLERRLKEIVGIDLQNQPEENAELARIGSISGRFGTIDLSSASDSLSLSTLDEFFPSRVSDVLRRFRSPVTTLPGGVDLDLHMVSSMGNAFTFPLQTIFFTALVIGAYKVLDLKVKHFRGHSRGSSTFAVFGDDIIVEKEAYDLVSRLLFLTGFRVNHDKSFNIGPFRESCGHDYYHGRNVRGVYIRRLSGICDKYSAINRLVRWSAINGVYLNHTVQLLLKGIRFLPVPFDEDDSCGIKVPFEMLERPIRRNDMILYRYLRVRPNSLQLQKLSNERGRSIGYFCNPAGLLLSFVGGYIRSGSITLRSEGDVRADVRSKWTPRWDFITSARGESHEFSSRWKLAASTILGRG